MAKEPTIADLDAKIDQLQGQVRQLIALVGAHNGVQPLDELRITEVARDFKKRGPEAIKEWNRAKVAGKRQPQRRTG